MNTWTHNTGPVVNADLKFDAVVKAVGTTVQVPVVDLDTIWTGLDDDSGPAGTDFPDYSAHGPRDTFHQYTRGHDTIAETHFKTLEE